MIYNPSNPLHKKQAIERIKCFIKFKIPRTIFFDESDGFFYYLNPYHLTLQKCGSFNIESEVING